MPLQYVMASLLFTRDPYFSIKYIYIDYQIIFNRINITLA